MKQVQLESYDNPGKHTTCWLDDITSKDVGKRITFKDGTELWTIKHVGSHDLDKSDVRKTWNVGGL